MDDLLTPPEQSAPELAQVPQPEPPSKRAKFLAKFAELDPDAELDERGLDAILADPKQRGEFAKYVTSLNPAFKLTGDELADELSKKKAQADTGVGSAGGETPPPAVGAPRPDVNQMERALGIDPADTPQPTFPPGTVPALTPQGLELPGIVAPGRQPAPAVAPMLESQQPYQPGTSALPMAANLPNPLTGDPATQGNTLPSPDEQAFLDYLPLHDDPGVRADGSDYPQTPYGKALVAVPDDYRGRVPAETFQLNLTGPGDRTQYFYRNLSDKVNGKPQSVYEAAAGRFKNSLYEMGQGGVEAAQAIANTPAALYELATDKPGYHADFGEQASASIEDAKTPLADLYTHQVNRHTNLNNLLLQSAEYAPLVVSQAVQTLAPELRVPGLLTKAIGTTAALGFDAQLVHNAREQAKAAGLTGNKADLYTTFVGGLTLAGFKAGGALVGKLGDKAALQVGGDELREAVALDAVRRVEQLEAQAGRAATQVERQGLLSQSVQAALSRPAQFVKGTLQQGATFPLAGTATTVGDQLAAPTLGGQAQPVTPGSFLRDRLHEAGEGLLMGGVTEGLRIGGEAAGALLRPRPTAAPEPQPQQGQLFNVVRPGGEVQLRDAQIVGEPDASGHVTVRGVTQQGEPTEQKVPGGWVYPARRPAPAPAAAELPETPAAPTSEQATIPTTTLPPPAEVSAPPESIPEPASETPPTTASDDLAASLPALRAPGVFGGQMADAFAHFAADPLSETARRGAEVYLGDSLESRNPNPLIRDAVARAQRLHDATQPEAQRLVDKANAHAVRQGAGLLPLAAPSQGGAPPAAASAEAAPLATPQAPPTEHPATPAPMRGTGRYHGSSSRFDELADTFGVGRWGSAADQLLGPGFYTTDDLGVAESYTTKGKGGNPTLYETKWVGEGEPNLLNMDKPLPPAILARMKEVAGSEDDLLPEKSGVDNYRTMLRNIAEQPMMTKGEMQETLQGLSDWLGEQGYHGFEHTGGGRYQPGSPSHQVHIYFDTYDQRTGKPNLDISVVDKAHWPSSRQAPETAAVSQAEAPRLPDAQPHPDHVKPPTPQQQAQNDALDALDRYNALNGTERRNKAGLAARKEAVQAAGKAGLTLEDKGGKLAAAGKRVTRSNEYTATTPAADHTPLSGRPAPVREFVEKVLASAEQAIATVQGLGLKVRGKELSARELQGAVADVRAGKNTLRAQLLLDVLENGHRAGYLEKSEGTGLATRKYQIPVNEFVGDAQPAARHERPLSDPEMDSLIADDPQVRQAVDDYVLPDGSVDYARLASDARDPQGGSGGLQFLYDLPEPVADKLKALADERARQAPSSVADQRAGVTPAAPAIPGGEAQGGAGVDEAGAGGPAGNAPAEVAPPADPVAGQPAPLTLAEQNAQAKQEFSDALAEFRAARAKGSNRLQSSVLGIPAFSPEEAAALGKMARAAIKLGAVKTKQVIARLRAQGLTDDDATDEQLRPFVKQLLTDEGLRQSKVPKREAAALPPNEPEGSATRSSMARLDADPTRPEALKEKVRDTGLDKYEPKSLAETNQAVDAYLQRNSLADAYAEAISTTDNLTGDVRTALRVRVLDAVGQQLNEALSRGDTASADTYLEQALKVTEALAKRGTDAGREINAYKLLVAHTPEAAVYQAQKDVAAQREKGAAKLGKKLRREQKAIEKAKREALDNALATSTVRAAREQVAGKQLTTTREKRAAIRAERDDLFAQLRNLSKKNSGQAFVSVVPITPQQAQAAVIHVKIFRTYLQEGLTHLTSMVERFKRDAGPAAAGYSDAELRKSAAAAKGDYDEAIRQGTAALGKTLDQIARDHLGDAAAVGKTLAEQFVQGAGLTPAEAKTYADAIEAEFARRIDDARRQRLAELNRRAQSTPAKRASQSDLDKTRELFTLSPTDDAAILDHLKRVNQLPELTAQDVADLRKLAEKVRSAPDGFQKDEAVENLLKAQAQIKGVKLADVGQALWYANVLSGYKTHVINLTANLIQTASELGTNTAYAVGAGRGRYATAGAKGLMQGVKRGAREAASVLTTGRETSRTPDKYEVPGILENIRFAGGVANPLNYLKFVNRALRAGDVLFSSGLKEMRAHDLAVKYALEDAKSDGDPAPDIWARAAEKLYNTTQRLADARAQATAEGLKGNDLERRIYEIAEQSRDAGMMEDAREYGTRAVFNGDVKGALGWVATGVQNITNGIDIAGFKPAKFVVPFTRVITNVANAYLDYTPVGAGRAARGGHLFGGNAESKLQRPFTAEERWKTGIKAVVGSSVAVAAYALSNNRDKDGKPTFELTGFGTGNPARDAQLRADGWQPYSIKVGDTWYSYANAPEAIMLAGVGSYNDGVKYGGEKADDQSALDKLFLNSFRALQFTKDMTALKGAADFLAAVDSREPGNITRWAQRLAAGSAKGYVPFSALLTQAVKDQQMLADAPKKQGRTFSQMLVQDIPVARNSVNDALDVLGDPLPVDTDRLFSSPPHRDEPTQRIWNWLNKNELFVSVPNRNSGGALVLRAHQGKETPMTDEEYYRFMRTRGQTLKGLLQAGLPDLEKLDAKQAALVLRRYGTAANTIAKAREFGAGAVPAEERPSEPDEE